MLVRVMVSTNKREGARLLHGHYNNLTWASNDMETVAHYYEGCVVELTVSLEEKLRMPYVRDMSELEVPVSEYGYGFAEMKYPPDAIWYSFSRNYLRTHVLLAKEIFPDLSKWED